RINAAEWTEKIGQGKVNWSAGYIEAVGIGATPDRTISKTGARPVALRAAKVEAYRNLLEIAKGVRVDSTTTVKDYTSESDVVNTQVEGLVKGGVIVDQRYEPDGTVEVRVRMPLHGNLAQVVIPASLEKRKNLKPGEPPSVPQPVAATPAPLQVYTGLIVDARGLQARPAMLPRILDEDGKEVYGTANVDRECAVSQGMSGYARDLAAARSNQRVTENPITIKGLRTGGAGSADIVISNADARQIRASAENASFMKKCRVMIVLD
ncbi:MAG: hypothetical protein ABRQ30_07360, partial [Smithellaceae bacterium]